MCACYRVYCAFLFQLLCNFDGVSEVGGAKAEGQGGDRREREKERLERVVAREREAQKMAEEVSLLKEQLSQMQDEYTQASYVYMYSTS